MTTTGWTQTINYIPDSPIDSLLRHVQKLEQQPADRDRDTALAIALDSCARHWILTGQPNKAIEPLRRFETITRQHTWPYGDALFLYRKGHYEALLGNAAKAKAYFLQAIPRLKRVSNTHIMLLAYVQMGKSEIDRDLTDTSGIRTVIRYLREGMAISLKTPDRLSYSALTFRLSRAYMQLQNYTQALHYLTESWQESQRNGYTEMPFLSCLHFAVCYTHLNDEAHRQPVWEKCQTFLPKLTIQERYDYYCYSADMHRYRQTYTLMMADGKQLLALAHAMQSASKRLQAHRILFEAYKQLNRPAAALDELELIKRLEDSTLQQRSNVMLAELQIKYDIEQQQAEVARLTIDNQRDQARFLGGGLLMLALLMSVIIYNNRRLRQKNRAIMSAQLQGQTLERQRVAADLHDNLGTTLTALHWSLDAIDKTKLSPAEQAVYATISQQLGQAYTDVRLLSHNLLPDELAKQGLAVALRGLVEKMNRNTPVRFRLSGADTLPRLDQQTEFELYSICLELLNNTIKHAHATEGHITLSRENGVLTVTVGDNGAGLDNQRTDGRGLQNVAARIDSLAGTWEVDSTPDGGVQNRIAVPVRTPIRVS
ncbi:MAG: hypothetical protein H7Z72_12300 [Bacteroidetes bacterium]|nr:hypothetical protein [Fibrella sp.]